MLFMGFILQMSGSATDYVAGSFVLWYREPPHGRGYCTFRAVTVQTAGVAEKK